MLFSNDKSVSKKYAAMFAALLACSSSHAADVTWTGASDSDWENGSNWNNNIGPTTSDRAYLNAGSLANYAVIPGIEGTINYRGVIQNGGVLNITAGVLTATELASATSNFNGTVNHSNGTAAINAILMGTANGSNGNYFLSGGELSIARGSSSRSLALGGLSTGSGTFTISGGRFITRDGVVLGSATNTGLGKFTIMGSGASQIGLGASSNDIDATWHQYAGSTLKVLMDAGGCTPIFIQDNSNTTGTSATFETGALIDLGFIGSGPGGTGGTWTVMEVQNGDIIGPMPGFAPGVDTNIWSVSIDNTGANGLLKVTSSYVNSDLNVYWDGSENTVWENPPNWSNNFGIFDNAYVQIPSGTVDFTAASERNVNIRGFRMSGGTLNFSGGSLRATARSADQSNLDGTTHHTGGYFDVNTLEIGSTTSSNASYTLTGGELKIGRASGGSSLYLGTNRSNTNAGNGELAISGGKFTTRAGVELGEAGKTGTGRFSVLGADASEITIAGANTDSNGSWVQNTGSTLEIGIDFEGVTPILLKDGTNAGTPSATFASGSFLDVHHHNITQGGGTWVVMEVENGTIDASGLEFAPGVDQNIWSKSVDTSGPNARLLVTAIGDPIGLDIVVGNTPQQKMRYGMDYERLWYWSSNLNSTERDEIARWTTVDAAVDFVRVAVNSEYELTEGNYNLSAYTDKIIPVMQEMQQANPKVKFFGSPRPLNEAVSGAAWQPYPIWITGAPSNTSSSFDFSWQKCSEYLVRYLLLMKSYGFKISFLDVTNEWQSNVGGGRLTQDDMDNIEEYLNVTYMAAPWSHPSYPGLTLTPEDIPEIVAPSSWNYSQGTSWINNLDAGDKAAISIAASHNTDRTGDAASFAAAARNQLGNDVEVWNTELHGWKSTSSENETTSFYYYIEAIRAGFGGINGWLAIGTTSQGHSYILNPSGTPTRNVKYYIYRKLSSTSNYGHALNILEEPDVFHAPLGSNDDDIPRNVAAFIKGNLMTVWVVNENAGSVPVVITPSGRTIAESNVRLTRWTDSNDVEGFVSFEPVTSNGYFGSTIPGQSVCCYEIVLNGEDFSNDVIQAEAFSHSWGVGTETTGDIAGGGFNVNNISNGDFTRYGDVALADNSIMSFRVARPADRPQGVIEIREGNSEGPLLGQVAVPSTGSWQSYQTISTTLNVDAGIYNLYLKFVESTTTTNNAFVNLNWFTVNDSTVPPAPTGLTATASGNTQINLAWNAVSGATSYNVLRSTTPGGSYSALASGLTSTSVSDATAAVGVPYYYVVRALSGTVESANSNEANATLPLSTPTGLTAANISSSQINLSWNSVVGATSYTVKRSTTSGGAYSPIASGLASPGYSDTNGLTPGTRYHYVVFASTSAVSSGDSAEASATPSDPIVPGDVVIQSMTIGDDGNGGQELSLSIEKSGLGQFHQVMKNVDLSSVWEVASPVYIGNGGLLEIQDIAINPGAPRFFYRVKVWRD